MSLVSLHDLHIPTEILSLSPEQVFGTVKGEVSAREHLDLKHKETKPFSLLCDKLAVFRYSSSSNMERFRLSVVTGDRGRGLQTWMDPSTTEYPHRNPARPLARSHHAQPAESQRLRPRQSRRSRTYTSIDSH